MVRGRLTLSQTFLYSSPRPLIPHLPLLVRPLPTRHHHLHERSLHPLFKCRTRIRRINLLWWRDYSFWIIVIHMVPHQHTIILGVGCVPQPFQSLNRLGRRKPRSLGLQRPKLYTRRGIIVEHPLRISQRPSMPLPIQDTFDYPLFSNTPNQWDVLARPDSLINDLIPYNQLPFYLLVYNITYHDSLLSLQLTRDPSRQSALPHRQPIPHRSYKAYESIFNRNLSEILRHQPVVFLQKERLPRCDPDWRLRRTHLPRIIRYQSLSQVPWHKTKHKRKSGVRAIRLCTVWVHIHRERIRNTLNINLLINRFIN